MDPMTIAALISAVPGAIQGLTGLFQSGKSKDILDGLERPTYEIPQAAQQALQLARVGAGSSQMAGQSNLESAQNEIFANTTGDIMSTATSGPEALAALIGAGKNRATAQNEIGFRAAQDYESRQRSLGSALGTYAGYQDKAFEINQMQPYQQKLDTASALGNAGMINQYQGIKDLAGIGANLVAPTDFADKSVAAGAASANNFSDKYGLSDAQKEYLQSVDPKLNPELFDLLQQLSEMNSAQFGIYGPGSAVQPMN